MSKTVVYGLNETLVMELKSSPVHVLSIHPGSIKINIANKSIGATNELEEGFYQLAKTSATPAALHCPGSY
jgi:short-subunit dehydrogenase